MGEISDDQRDDEKGEKSISCACEEALPELARQAIEKFNQAEFYAQHDLLEALWVDTPGSIRGLYKGILQVGVGYFQILQGNRRGAIKMLRRSAPWLASMPDVCQGVDVAQLIADSNCVRGELERLGEENFHEFDLALLKPVQFEAT